MWGNWWENVLKGGDPKFSPERKRRKPLPTSRYDEIEDELLELMDEEQREKHKEKQKRGLY